MTEQQQAETPRPDTEAKPAAASAGLRDPAMRSPQELEAMTLEELLEAMDALPKGPPWSKEETLMSTPYSDVESWLAMLIGQTLRGGSRLMGPPGLREEVEHQLSSSMGPEMISWLFERTTPTGKTLDDWVAGFMERAAQRLG